MNLAAYVIAMTIVLVTGLSGELQAAPANRLTIDQLMQIKHPSNPVISPDGQYVVYLWDEGGIGNLYAVKISGTATSPRKLTSFSAGQVGEAFWRADSKVVYFPHEGALWQADVKEARQHMLAPMERELRAPDSRYLLMGDAWLLCGAVRAKEAVFTSEPPTGARQKRSRTMMPR